MAAVYGFKPWEVELLTFTQLNEYVSNVRYVIPDSQDFMNPPDLLPHQPEMVRFALDVGVIIPRNILFEMGVNEGV